MGIARVPDAISFILKWYKEYDTILTVHATCSSQFATRIRGDVEECWPAAMFSYQQPNYDAKES